MQARAEVPPARAQTRPPRVESAPPERPVVREKALVTRAEPAIPARPTPPSARASAPKRADMAVPPESPATTSTSTREEALRAAGIELTRLAPGMSEWSYEGESGPDNWGRMRPEWRICEEGLRQSPIDLRDGDAVQVGGKCRAQGGEQVGVGGLRHSDRSSLQKFGVRLARNAAMPSRCSAESA